MNSFRRTNAYPSLQIVREVIASDHSLHHRAETIVTFLNPRADQLALNRMIDVVRGVLEAYAAADAERVTAAIRNAK